MSITIDARGLSCPQPVLLTMDEIRSGSQNEIIVRVDTDTSRENVSRAALSQGCRVESIQPDGDGYRVTIIRG
mgnify:CR=1 FL=1